MRLHQISWDFFQTIQYFCTFIGNLCTSCQNSFNCTGLPQILSDLSSGTSHKNSSIVAELPYANSHKMFHNSNKNSTKSNEASFNRVGFPPNDARLSQQLGKFNEVVQDFNNSCMNTKKKQKKTSRTFSNLALIMWDLSRIDTKLHQTYSDNTKLSINSRRFLMLLLPGVNISHDMCNWLKYLLCCILSPVQIQFSGRLV